MKRVYFTNRVLRKIYTNLWRIRMHKPELEIREIYNALPNW